MISVKIISIITILAFVMGGSIVYHHYNDADDQEITVLTETGEEDTYFHNHIKERSDAINNSITAMLKGQEEPGNVISLISTEAVGTSHDTEYSQEEREINEHYKDFLDIAYKLSYNYINKYPIEQDLHNLTQAKELI
jgi:hypothetical protein